MANTQSHLSSDWVEVAYSMGDAVIATREINIEDAKALTTDREPDIGGAIARLLVDPIVRFADPWAIPDQYRITIVAPNEYAGAYAIHISLRVKEGKVSRPYAEVSQERAVGRTEVVVGMRGVKLSKSSATVTDRHGLPATLMPSNTVEDGYVILGSIDGDGGLYPICATEEEMAVIDHILADQNNGGSMYDNGWAAKCLSTDQIGFLARSRVEIPGYDEHVDAVEYRKAKGLALQRVTRWAGKPDDILLCFIPPDRIAEAGQIAEDLVSMVCRPKAQLIH